MRFFAIIISFLVLNGMQHTVFAACTNPTLSPDAVNVTDYGAIPDDFQNDTTAIQDAIDATPPGGTLFIPAGEYLVETGSPAGGTGLVLHSNLTIYLDPNAVIQAISTDLSTLNWLIGIFYASDITITGGTIKGERDGHLGTIGEAGHNILIWNSSNITLTNIDTINAWGDGISVTGELTKTVSENISLCGVRADNNRRHGLALIYANNVLVEESIFSNSNGADPESGIDFEPNTFSSQQGYVTNATVTNNEIFGNQGNGIILHGINGIVQNNIIQHNHIYGNKKKAVRMEAVSGNTFFRNFLENNGTDHIGWYPVIDLYNTDNIIVETNSIRDGSAAYAQDGIMLRGTSTGNIITNNDICVDSPDPIHDMTTDHAFSVSSTTYCTRLPHIDLILPPPPPDKIPLAHLSLLLK